MTAPKKAPPTQKKAPAEDDKPRREGQWNFFPAWCKACGNCAAFCPRQALKLDDLGRPYMAEPARCTVCGLCEKLCPDFAISVGDATVPAPSGAAGEQRSAQASPERVPPTLESRENK